MTLPMANKTVPHWGKKRHLMQLLVVATFFLAPIPIPGIPGLEKGLVKLDFTVWNIHFLGWTLPKEHFYLFFIAAIIAVIALTVVAFSLGKVFCGWACPQNIYYELLHNIHSYLKKHYPLYRRSPRIQWATDLILTLLFATATVYTLNNYFLGAHYLFHTYISVASFSLFVTLVHVLKHKFCTNACPYHYVQKSLQTPTTLHINYDSTRPGAPCGTCYACHRACYVDIDIRKDRNHHDCTLCGACVDACESVYRNKEEPALLLYSLQEQGKEENNPHKILKRVLTGIVIAACVGYIALFIGRPMDKIQFGRQSTPTEHSPPATNTFQIKVKNLRIRSMAYRLVLETEGFHLDDNQKVITFSLLPHEQEKRILTVHYEGDLKSLGIFHPIAFRIESQDDSLEIKRFDTNFMTRPPKGSRH